jgi:hypothetical protein
MDADAADPRRSPGSEDAVAILHPAAQQVEGEHLEEERGFVGVEAVGGDLADFSALQN